MRDCSTLRIVHCSINRLLELSLYFHFFLLTNVQKSSFWWMLWKVGLLVLRAARTFHALRLLGTRNAETSVGMGLDGTNAFTFSTKALHQIQIANVWKYCKFFLAAWRIVQFCCLFSSMAAKYLLINKTLQSLPLHILFVEYRRRVFMVTSKLRVSSLPSLAFVSMYTVQYI